MDQGISSKFKNENDSDLNKLDGMVMDYLSYRGYEETLQQLRNDIDHGGSKHVGKIKKSNRGGGMEDQNIADNHVGPNDGQTPMIRILNTFDNGDYSSLLNLWDAFVLSEIKVTSREFSKAHNNSLVQEMLHVEFLMHICTSAFPFRLETLKRAGSPKVAAIVAARSMTIFKHYIESRGPLLQQFESKGEFQNYRNLHRIAFPPTHPIYKHIFTRDWINMVRCALIDFLVKFFFARKAPTLVKIFKSSKNAFHTAHIMETRESSLLKLSESIFLVSEDLLNSAEKGIQLDKKLLRDIREKFDILRKMVSSNVKTQQIVADQKEQISNQQR